MNILNADLYDAMITESLVELGLSREQAEEVCSRRFPLSADGVLAECCGRGACLTPTDLQDFLFDRYERKTFDDGEPLSPNSIGWPRHLIDSLLMWAERNRRAKPVKDIPDPTLQLVSVQDMLAGLRSGDLADRIVAGVALARSLGVGLALQREHLEDVEHIIAPELSGLLGRAMAGEVEAVDELTAHVTSEHPVSCELEPN
jgi:hypothetical protein